MLHGENKDSKCNFIKKVFLGFLILLIFVYYLLAYKVENDSPLSNIEQENSNAHSFSGTVNGKFMKMMSHPIYNINYKTTAAVVSNLTLSFDINSSDIIVFLHMQKTGGTTFGLHLVHDLESVRCIKKPDTLKQRYNCYRPNKNSEWLFSRYSTGWKCGMHADWTTLTECVSGFFERDNQENKRYFYITILRNPVARYISEWLHVSRGATWENSYRICNDDIYYFTCCWNGSDWKGVGLDEFMDCYDNVANNRQTKMLADMRKINCSETELSETNRNKIILESAKENLQNMVFFGITEQQEKTQALFERAFNLHFKVNLSVKSNTRVSNAEYTNTQIKRVKKLNKLDMELFDFATKLFEKRYKEISFT